jgi:phosphoribosylformylglycinamidine synthase
VAGEPPRLDLAKERALQHLVVALIQSGLALSAHDCSEGGLAVTLAECAFDTGGIGLEASLEPVSDVPPEMAVVATLFGESASRVVLSVDENDVARVLDDARAAGVPARVIGRTGGRNIRVGVGGREALCVPVAAAEQAWATAIERYYHATPGAA